MIRLMERRVVSSVVMLAALAAAVTMIVKNHEAPETSASVEAPGAPASESRMCPLVAPSVPEQQRSLAPTEEAPDAVFLAQVEHKYRFLIADVEEEHIDELRRRLLERESQIDVGSRDRIDAGIGKLLPAEAHKHYKEDFIAEAAPPLTQEQYREPEHHETTEFAREPSRLQQRNDSK